MLSIILTIFGLWALVTGKVPAAVSGKNYSIEGTGARILGAILLLPLPLSFLLGLIGGMALGDAIMEYAVLVDLVVIVGVLIAAAVVSRMVRKPVAAG